MIMSAFGIVNSGGIWVREERIYLSFFTIGWVWSRKWVERLEAEAWPKWKKWNIIKSKMLNDDKRRIHLWSLLHFYFLQIWNVFLLRPLLIWTVLLFKISFIFKRNCKSTRNVSKVKLIMNGSILILICYFNLYHIS